MKKRNKIFLLLIIAVSLVLVRISFAPDVSIISIVINLFAFTDKRGNLDVTWDYVIVDNPSKSGRNKWEIGLADEKINIYETATAPVVKVQVYKEIDMNYTSKEDYYSRGGPEAFRRFIEENNK